MIATVPPAIVAKGEVLARSLQRSTNQDFVFTGNPVRAKNPLCQSRGGTHYACRLVMVLGRQRAVRFYPNCTIYSSGEWACRNGELLPW